MVGKRISEERERLGLTQKDLGELWNVGRSAVAMIESGRSPLVVDRLLELEKLGVDIQYVLFGQRSTQIASRMLDWQLLTLILKGVRQWSSSHGIRLAPEKEAVFLKLFYDLFVASGAIDEAAMNEALSLAA